MTNPVSKQYTALNGLQIHCVEKPGTSETTILFVHGRCMSVRVWEEQFASPLLSPYRLLAFDLPGHGESGRAADPSGYSLEKYKGTLLALIGRYQLTNYILVGLSLGGHIALQALPDLHGCRGIFAMTVPIAKPMEAQRMYTPAWLNGRALQPNPSPADVDEYANQLLRFTPNHVPDFLTADFNRTDPAIHAGLLQSIIDGHYESEQELIEKTSIPVAIVVGTEDQIHNLSYPKTPAPAIWRQKPQLVGAAGHLLPWENPVAVNELLVRFTGDIQ